MLVRVLLLALSVGVALEATVVGALLVRAHRARCSAEAFRCRASEAGARPGRFRNARRSQLGWASWAHAVLVVRTGRLGRTAVLPVRFPEGSVTPVSHKLAKGLGPHPVLVQLRLDDDRLIELAVRAEERERVAGPFLAACVLAPDR